MKIRSTLLLVAWCASVGCQSTLVGAPFPAPSSDVMVNEGEVIFYVHGWVQGGPRMLENVRVWLVDHDGEFHYLGHTDVFGGR